MIHFDAKKTFCKNIFKRKQIIHNTHAHTKKKQMMIFTNLRNVYDKVATATNIYSIHFSILHNDLRSLPFKEQVVLTDSGRFAGNVFVSRLRLFLYETKLATFHSKV